MQCLWVISEVLLPCRVYTWKITYFTYMSIVCIAGVKQPIIMGHPRNMNRQSTQKTQGWRTRAQIIALHGGDSKVADEIISEKLSCGLVDDHPDVRGLKTYYVSYLKR